MSKKPRTASPNTTATIPLLTELQIDDLFYRFALPLITIFPLMVTTAGSTTESSFYGVATLDKTGTLCLQLRTEEPGKPVAEGYFCYKPSDPDYSTIRDHIGPIKTGEQKVIKPFNP